MTASKPGLIFKAAIPLLLPLVLVGAAMGVDALLGRPLWNLVSGNTPDLEFRVAGHPVTKSQLQRATRMELWLRGTPDAKEASPEWEGAVKQAWGDLVDHELMRLEIDASEVKFDVSEQEIDQRVLQFASRFESREKLEQSLRSQGFGGMVALRERCAATIRQDKWLAAKIAKEIAVSDAEAKAWYDQHAKDVALPERVAARHVFIATLEKSSDDVKQKLEAALADLTAKKKDFAALATELSEDEASKGKGGELGWMTQGRLPADFGAAVFSLDVNQPELVRSKLGWHIVEITARKPAEQRSFEQVKAEIVAALEATKRRDAVAKVRKQLLDAHAKEIEYF